MQAVDVVVVAVDDLIAACKRNRRDADKRRSHVLRATPPFEGRVELGLYVSEEGNYYPPEMDPKPVHLAPQWFFAHDDDTPATTSDIPIPTWAESRRLARDDHGDDVSEETVEEYHAVAMDQWESRVRANLRDEVLVDERTNTTVAVEYRE